MAAGQGWLGALTPTSVVIATPAAVGASVVVAHASNSGLTGATRTTPVTVDATGVAKVTVTGLTAGTVHFYTVEINGVAQTWTGRFRTPTAALQPGAFSVGFGSCMRSNQDALIFDAIAARHLDLFVHSGDWVYSDIATNDPALFRDAILGQLAQTKQGACWRSTPVAYVMDDHDYGPDNSDRTSPARDAAMTAYRQTVPHYPLADTSPTGTMNQAFSLGRVRFIVLDCRSARDPNDDPQTPTKTMLGAAQKAWLKAELLASRPAGHLITVIVSPNVWKTDSNGGDTDSWGQYTHERREIADFIAANNLSRGLVMIDGDSHLTAMDDGRHNDYSTAGGARFPLVTAGPINQSTNAPGKGGPYLYGPFLNERQYVTGAIADDGAVVTVTWTGWSVDNTTGAETQLCQMVTTSERAAGPAATGAASVGLTAWDGEAHRPVKMRRRTANDYEDLAVKIRT